MEWNGHLSHFDKTDPCFEIICLVKKKIERYNLTKFSPFKERREIATFV